MKYSAKQLQMMAQVVTDAKTNSTHNYMLFMMLMMKHTGMSKETVEKEIETYL